MNEILEKWIKIADNDFKSAQSLMKDNLFGNACFHCQQAAEKYLKAFLVANNREFPKVHDLEYLVEMAKHIDPDFEEITGEALALTDYATIFRYPGDEPVECAKEDCLDALSQVGKVKEFIEKKLKDIKK